MRGATKRRAIFRGRHSMRLVLLSGCAWVLAATPALASDIAAAPPSDLSVTVYRAPGRDSGTLHLDRLQGFALVSETRTIRLPAGLSRLRFEGVADGIEPASAIVTGLAGGVIEKNREGQVLSPSALLAAAVDKPVTLLRTDKKTGKLTRVAGTVRSDAEGGVVFETSEGLEGLRCSGLPESFSFAGVTDLAATPTLSVLVRSATPLTSTVTLSYLARGFDWAADYTATLSADGKSLDLGAWVTLANGNGVGFPTARTQVVAGRVNRESGEVQPIDLGGPIMAQCWPQGSTSDSPQYLQLESLAVRQMDGLDFAKKAIMSIAAAAPLAEVAVRAVEQEQLGDLKLYRMPDRTTVASRQSKQVRLLDRSGIPVSRIYGADFAANQTIMSVPASLVLRTQNNAANHLGLPLPSGHIAVFATRGEERLLLHESNMRDLAVDEEVEISMGSSADVEVTAVREKTSIDPSQMHLLPVPGVPGVLVLRSAKVDDVTHVDISNARAADIQFELRLKLPEGGRVIRADHPLGTKNGRPIFRLTIPANQTVTLRYQTQHGVG